MKAAQVAPVGKRIPKVPHCQPESWRRQMRRLSLLMLAVLCLLMSLALVAALTPAR